MNANTTPNSDGSPSRLLRSPAGKVAAAFIALSVGLGLVVQWRYSEIPFDAERWKQAPGQRARMTKALVESQVLLEQAEPDVRRLLGSPDAESAAERGASRNLLYRLGSRGVQDSWFVVVLEEGHVVRAGVQTS